MPETTSTPHRSRPPIRSRIGADLAGGFYPAPHRYHLYLSAGCPSSLRVSITLDLLELRDSVSTTVLAPDAPMALDSLHRYYEATEHHFDGTPAVPALCDRWSGHVVSNHTPDILRDLACRLAAHGGDPLLVLRPCALAAQIDAVHERLAARLFQAPEPVLGELDRRLATRPYIVGAQLTAADVDLWATLVHLPRQAAAAARSRTHVRAYVERLHDHPAFRANHPPTARTKPVSPWPPPSRRPPR
ncbi:glutathione S-transferase C-terminal domain-containing protein [Streptomyces sp. NPDC048436]|uniref:glutathione S-transferase C-terminal domain-containing protein n=1 Tax=Streptomyces sp. NPDC048436 TaxID=3365550 RepID=UPI003710824F